LHVLTFNGNSNQSPKVDVDHVIVDPIQVEVKLDNNKKMKKHMKLIIASTCMGYKVYLGHSQWWVFMGGCIR